MSHARALACRHPSPSREGTPFPNTEALCDLVAKTDAPPLGAHRVMYVEDPYGYLGCTRLDPSIPVRGLSPRSLSGHEPCTWLSCADYIPVGIAPFIFAPELSSVQCVLLTFSLILDLFPIVCFASEE